MVKNYIPKARSDHDTPLKFRGRNWPYPCLLYNGDENNDYGDYDYVDDFDDNEYVFVLIMLMLIMVLIMIVIEDHHL